MKKMKKFSAALLAVVLLVSMLSCMVLGTSATPALGGPVSVEEHSVPVGQVATGIALPANILVVNDDWSGKVADDSVTIKLNGTVYKGVFSKNAFGTIAGAVAAAQSSDTIYVAAGEYTDTINLTAISHLKIYGPFAGVNPNMATGNVEDIAIANTAARPHADELDAKNAAQTEAVFYGVINLNTVQHKPDMNTEVAGFYFAGASYVNLSQGGTYRVGTYLHNNVVNSTASSFFAMNKGINPVFAFNYNRVLNAKNIRTVGGFSGDEYIGNYFNLTNYMLYITSVQNGSVGYKSLIKDNYFENCAGMVMYGPNDYQTVSYSIDITGNYVKNVVAGTYIIKNEYDAFHSLPGISVQVTNNQFYGIPKGTILFQFPYRQTEANLSRYRYIVNINNNTFDLPENQVLVSAEMAGVVNCSRNRFTTPVKVRQINCKYDDCKAILYPYYNITTGEWVGETKVTDVTNAVVNEAEQTILMDMIAMGSSAPATVELKSAVTVNTGCSFKVFEDPTLVTEVKNRVLYFAGTKTTRYIAVYTPDGELGNVYTLTALRSQGTDAELLAVNYDSDKNTAVQNGSTFTITLPKDRIALDYSLKVSAGATYQLFSDAAYTKALADQGNYIPYGTTDKYYTIYVKVTSQNGLSNGYYKLVIERDLSAAFDPSITGLKTPTGYLNVRSDPANAENLYVSYSSGGKMLGNTVFDFTTTPGATYTIYADSTKKTVLSTSAALKALPLKAGQNEFYVEIQAKDVLDPNKTVTNVATFVVFNETYSTDAEISGLVGQNPTINNNKIYASIGGDSFSATFNTRSKYATCKVYADAAKKVEITYSSAPVVEPTTNRIIDQRSFNLPSEHANNKYYVVCTAEDGVTTKEYELYLQKNVAELIYVDVPEKEWYYDAVYAATKAGIVNGEKIGEEQYFHPNDNTSREEMATIIARLLGINGAVYANEKLNYADEKAISEWALNNVKACKIYGIMKGSSEATGLYFLPQDSISREEVMAIMARIFNLKGTTNLSRFKDANMISAWAVPEVQATVAASIFLGDDQGYLNPQNDIARSEIAAIISRVLDRI